VFARNDGPTLFVDHLKLPEPLTPEEVRGMAAVELSTLKEQQPNTPRSLAVPSLSVRTEDVLPTMQADAAVLLGGLLHS
jgi:hypothetical protein